MLPLNWVTKRLHGELGYTDVFGDVSQAHL
jgi:hypothetical protein